MDQFLAEHYGTNKTAAAAVSEEDTEKAASVELFMKLASDQKIDLANMPEEQVTALYNTWAAKVASEQAAPPAPAATQQPAAPDAKIAAAQAEFLEKKAAADKIAEADFLGRVMAHAYTQELFKIAEAHKEKAAELPEAFRKNMEAKKGEGGEEKKDEKKDKEEEKKEGSAKKTASAIDDLAVPRAIAIVKEAGLDADQAARKVAAVLELNLLGESQKTASAANLDQAVHIRALEMLERAGYPINWNQQ